MKVDFRSSNLGPDSCRNYVLPKIVSNNIPRADLTENLTCSTIQYLSDLRRRLLAGLHLKYNPTTHRRHVGRLCVGSERRCRAQSGSPPETVVLPPYLSSLSL
ncbi:hypothetical protein HanXRQr2_Chr13g0601341 [Helianthus annuus]|uniref:Uncharacterized protein n=1 Tax=Helianthus annuus TaxID=4232 RepID=A0A9K3EKI2_HELAN|nr:hypothetical protein HanXRQr2_Chr13g0601341 [Helianthus annuus]KAJ0850328.1 hypothetical protein HanPSC8_Chr13g0579361 [Helianthus annuus]